MREDVRVKAVLQKTIEKHGRKGYIIYPFGELGKLVKKILNNDFAIYESMIIDNKPSKERNCNHMKAFTELKSHDFENHIILLASNNEENYRQIRNQLLLYVDLEQVVDIFSFSLYFHPELYYEESVFDYYNKGQINFRNRQLEFVAREIYKNKIQGDVAEVGVFRGAFADLISRFLPDRNLYLFDTFSGFDDRDITEEETSSCAARSEYNNFSDTSVDIALNNITYNYNCIVRSGYFPDTLKGMDDNRCFSLVSLDTDLAKPIMAGLEYFYPRMSPGGYIIVDNYNCTAFPTVRRAVIDYCRENNVSYTCTPKSSQESGAVIIAKPL